MTPADVITGKVWEDSGAYLMARVRGNGGANITQASITGITCKVYDLDNSGTLVSTTTPSKSDVIFDTLQTRSLDPRWQKDNVGYNFGYAVPASAFPTGDRRYRVEVVFDPVSGDDFAAVFEVEVQALLSS